MIVNDKGNLEINYGPYKIDELGNVSRDGKLLKPYVAVSRSGKEYLKVDLSINGNKEKWYVHRLVIYVFFKAIFGEVPKEVFREWEVDHDDRNTRNNKLWNLSACSPSNNQRHWRGMEIKEFWTEDEIALIESA